MAWRFLLTSLLVVLLAEVERDVGAGKITPSAAAEKLVAAFRGG